MRPRRGLLALAVALAAGALVAACGDGGEPAAIREGTPAAGSPLAAGQVRLTYYGHSMFTIESPGGVVVLTDPNEGIGYREPEGEIDVVTVSHEHFDHNKVEIAPGARALRGLTDSGDWAEIDETVGDVRIRTVPTYHDDKEGAERGKNAMFVFDVAGMRIVHAGDLGHADISFEAIKDLEGAFRPDVLLIPVGGYFTIGPVEAGQVIEDLRPGLAIPMHYRRGGLPRFRDSDRLALLGDFLAGGREVVQESGSSVVLEAGSIPTGAPMVLVLEPQPE